MDCSPISGDITMDVYYEVLLRESKKQLDRLTENSSDEMKHWDTIELNAIERTPSDLDAWDYCFCIAIGLVSPLISTNESLQDYLTKIHDCASEAKGEYDFLQRVLGTLLHHKGDSIDQPNKKFIKRDKENAWVLFHRLLWGHDPLSKHEDNPFYLMIKEQGLSGIIQAIQHLLADTTSKQGLPIPGSSYLDYNDENGVLSNYLIDIAQNLSVNAVGSKREAQAIYSHLFTVRASDLIGGGAIFAFSEIYFKARSISDSIRKCQFRLISYSICFWLQMLIGVSNPIGLPFVNHPAGYEMLKHFVKLYITSNQETRRIAQKQKHSEIETKQLEDMAKRDFEDSPHHNDAEAYLAEFSNAQRNVEELIGLWNGDDSSED